MNKIIALVLFLLCGILSVSGNEAEKIRIKTFGKDTYFKGDPLIFSVTFLNESNNSIKFFEFKKPNHKNFKFK